MFDPGKSGDSYSGQFPSPNGGRKPSRRSPGGSKILAYARRLVHSARALTAVAGRLAVEAFHALRRFTFSLSGQLLIATAIFVAIVEVVILVPDLASDQERWLTDRVVRAEIASQAVDTSQSKQVSQSTSDQLRKSAGVTYLAIFNDGIRSYRLWDRDTVVPDEVVDLRRSHKSLGRDLIYLWAPWQTLLGDPDHLIHLEAKPQHRHDDLIEIVVPAKPLRDYLRASLSSMLRVSLGISLAAGILVFAGLSFWVVRPITRLTHAIQGFRTNPEDISATPRLSGRADEIGHIENELVSMQEEVRNALRSRARLAALGQAVSKINHDLRNMLTAAQMASDRLSAASADPTVAKALPRLERALDRALSLATNVLTYGKSDERAPVIQILKLKDTADAAAEDAGLCLPGAQGEGVRFSLKAPKGFFLEADPEQLHRLLVNLMRNARQAIELQPNRRTLGRVTVQAIKTVDDVILIVGDNGPGIPEKAREKLFQPFTSSNTPGGTGLGLAIARELAQLHGGDVRLVNTGPEGTAFEVRLPLKGKA